MNSFFLSRYIKDNLSKYYGFAFVLTPNDLQANQLIIDAAIYFAEGEGKKIFQSNIWSDEEIKQKFLKRMTFLGKKRARQLGSFQYQDDHHIQGKGVAFFKLGVDERIALFLKYQFKLSLEEIAFITDEHKYQALTCLQEAKRELMNGHGKSSYLEEVPQ